MGLEFRRGGRKVSLDRFMHGMKDDILKTAEEAIEKKLRAVRGPESGEGVTFTRRYVTGEPRWDVKGPADAVAEAPHILGDR